MFLARQPEGRFTASIPSLLYCRPEIKKKGVRSRRTRLLESLSQKQLRSALALSSSSSSGESSSSIAVRGAAPRSEVLDGFDTQVRVNGGIPSGTCGKRGAIRNNRGFVIEWIDNMEE